MAFFTKEAGGDAGAAARPRKKLTPAEELWDLIKTLFYAVLIAVALRIVIFQPFNIPSGSMKPNLLIGDFLFVSKPVYGYSRASLVYPFTRLPIEGRIFGHEPRRGDVVVFKNRKDGNKDYIKRLIGLPGDEIRMSGGLLYVNGRPVEKEFAGMLVAVCDGRRAEIPTYRETLPNGASYIVEECYGDRGPLDDVGPYQVPAGHYFMMGDNRDQSQDSRVTAAVGYVPFDDIVGKAQFLFFSVDGEKTRLWTPWSWPFAIRYGRIFDPVR